MNLIRRTVIAASMAAVCFMPTPSMHASPLRVAPLHAYLGKVKTVQFSVRNDTGMAISLHAGDVVMTLDPGKTMLLKLPEGTRVMSNTDTPKHKVGEVIVEVSTAISGATVAIG